MAEAGFKAIQYQFAAHLRDPRNNPPPANLERRRTDLYCDLAFANVRNFVGDNFPVMRRLYDEAAWDGLVRAYFAQHRNRTPLFSRLATEFIDYLANERDEPGDPPFLAELAHYEWMESALRMADASDDLTGVDAGGDLLEGVPVLSTLAWPLSYRFPVHRIGPDFRPDGAPEHPTYLVIYRNDRDDVGFLELNAVAARLMELLGQDEAPTGRDALSRIAAELSHPDPELVMRGGEEMLRQWRDRQIVLGARSRRGPAAGTGAGVRPPHRRAGS